MNDLTFYAISYDMFIVTNCFKKMKSEANCKHLPGILGYSRMMCVLLCVASIEFFCLCEKFLKRVSSLHMLLHIIKYLFEYFKTAFIWCHKQAMSFNFKVMVPYWYTKLLGLCVLLLCNTWMHEWDVWCCRLWSRVLYALCFIPLFHELHLNRGSWSPRFNRMSSLSEWHSFICDASGNKTSNQGDCKNKFVPVILFMFWWGTRAHIANSILQARVTLL